MHAIHTIKAFEIVGPHQLRIEFGDGIVRTIDFRSLLEGELYSPLRDLTQFNAVTLDQEIHTLVWPDGSDLGPATPQRWPETEAEVVAMARRWASQAGPGTSEI